jgi:hypothetical protein
MIFGVPTWGALEADQIEHVPQLKWPQSIQTYDRMRADPQIDALLRGLVGPIRRFRWAIDPAGAKKGISSKIAEDLGLPLLSGKNIKRKLNKRRQFKHDDHLRTTLDSSLTYGHMGYEQNGEIRDGLWRLKKLAPRWPHSITNISVARDGGLEWIEQGSEWKPVRIPISRLVWFSFDRVGANWFGRSLLRSAYQPWLLKDRLLRVDAIRHERNGMGVPTVEMPERATPAQIAAGEKLAQQYQAGMASGGALPFGMKLRLVGVEGTTSDVLASIMYHDSSIARVMIQAFASMGNQGQYQAAKLGDAFIGLTGLAQDTIADWYCETMNEHVILDWVEWNYGPDEEAPLLVYKREEDPELSAQELAQMVAMGALTVDDELENFLRERYGLPPLTFSPDQTGRRRQLGVPKSGKGGRNEKTGAGPDGEMAPSEGKTNPNASDPPPTRTGKA